MRRSRIVIGLGVAAVVGLLAVGVWLAAGRPGLSGLSSYTCGDPFADAGPLDFPTQFWDLTDFCQHSIPYGEIVSGGVLPDAIPPLDEFWFDDVSQARRWLNGRSPVIAVRLGETARAYPLAILLWHEIVNDEIDGLPVAITYCPLCNSAIVFARRVDGQTLRFGTTGNLHHSNLLMWDDATHSWWQQFTGEAVVGSYTGAQLDLLPSQMVGFADFAAQFPEGEVLSNALPFGRNYGVTPYAYYDTEGQPMLPGAEMFALEERLPPTARVLAGVINETPVAYPFSLLAREGAVNDEVGGMPVVALWQVGVASPLDTPQIDHGREVGTAALYRRAVNGQTLTFTASASGTLSDAQTGSRWNAFGIATDGPLAGTELEPLPAGGHFWFAWLLFHPEPGLYTGE